MEYSEMNPIQAAEWRIKMGVALVGDKEKVATIAEMQLDLSHAWGIAVEVHGNQRDKAGEPYLFHIARVAMAMDNDLDQAVAILHDSLEDSATALDRGRLVHRIGVLYGANVEETVAELTRLDHEPYMDYIRRLSVNPLAVKVKLADLNDNSRPERLAKLPELEGQRLWTKYREALAFLYSIPAESPEPRPPGKS